MAYKCSAPQHPGQIVSRCAKACARKVGWTYQELLGRDCLQNVVSSRIPEGLCEELAKAYLLELEHHPLSKEVEEILSKEDCKDPYEVSKAADREKENEQCIGG